jgi:predicted RNA-binding Zn-ribbon protein involved in translation (DUF1610 family)/uncharacterized small protein (DUF1192 family)
MDLTLITGLVSTVREGISLLNTAKDAKADNEVKAKLEKALISFGDVVDKSSEIQEELARLQKENAKLKAELQKQNDWEEKISDYKLVTTKGGATVYESINNETKHYICPSCLGEEKISIIQQVPDSPHLYSCNKCNMYYQLYENQCNLSNKSTTNRITHKKKYW